MSEVTFIHDVAHPPQAKTGFLKVNGTVPAGQPTISGQTIAKSKWTAQERAALAAEWRLGRALIKPTTRLAAAVFGVSVQLVNVAIAKVGVDPTEDTEYARWLNNQDERWLNNSQGSPGSETLAEHLLRSTPEDLLEAARAVGPEVIWDRMLAPIV